MKIYNKKGFALGLLWTVLGGIGVVVRLRNWQSVGEDLSSLVFLLAVLSIGVGNLARSLSRVASLRDRLEGLDERDQLLTLKIQSKVMDLLLDALIVVMLVGGVGCLFTGDDRWASLFYIPAALVGVYSLIYCIVSAYYERHS